MSVIKIKNDPIFNVFDRELIRGKEKFPDFMRYRKFAYVEHPVEGWRVFLRSCAFIRVEEMGAKDKFIVVKSTNRATWEPPKGLLEDKDLGPRENILTSLLRNVRREIEEEAAVYHTKSIKYTGLALQGQETSYPPNWYFQYHLFEVVISQSEWMKIQEHFNWIAEHPASFARLKRDYREKNAVAIYDSEHTHLSEPLGKALINLYLK